jgi:LacI family transcriptional regulator
MAIINWDRPVSLGHFEDAVRGRLGREVQNYASRIDNDGVCKIAFDDAAAGRLATSHLIELGHSHFVHLRGPDVRSSLLRLLGFRQELEFAGKWPQTVLSATSPVLGSREVAIYNYLESARRPVAMVTYDDLSAVAALRAAHRAGWHVPTDLSIVGIDDIQLAAYTNPGLTTVAQPKQELGALAVDALLDRTGEIPKVPMLDGRLVLRGSTAPPVDRQRSDDGQAEPFPRELLASAPGEA